MKWSICRTAGWPWPASPPEYGKDVEPWREDSRCCFSVWLEEHGIALYEPVGFDPSKHRGRARRTGWRDEV